MANTLPLLETMSALTAQMVLAAREQDWDRLCELEAQVAALRDKLISEDSPGVAAIHDATTRSRKAELIKRMLEDDREIRLHTEPWMDSVRALLAGNTRERNVRMAYGSLGQ